jgi:20S proteasome alpha/beta subunit
MTVVNFEKLSKDSGLLLCDERVSFDYPPRVYDIAKKIYPLKDACFIGISGSPSDFQEVYRSAQKRINRLNIGSNEEMEQVLKDSYMEAKDRTLQERVLSPYRLTWTDFHRRELSEQIRERIIRKLERPEQHDWSVQAVVGGYVGHDDFSVYYLNYPGTVRHEDYYATTGSGYDRADLVFGDRIQEMSRQKKENIPLVEGVRIIFDATRSAWRNVGVGGLGQFYYINRAFGDQVSQQVREYAPPEIRLLHNVLYLEKRKILDEKFVNEIIEEVVEKNEKAQDIIPKIKNNVEKNIGKEALTDELFNTLHL